MQWDSYCFEEQRRVQQEYDDYIENPFEAVDGVIQCPKCKQFKTFSFQKQSRSADEPMTTYSNCLNRNCNHKWREG